MGRIVRTQMKAGTVLGKNEIAASGFGITMLDADTRIWYEDWGSATITKQELQEAKRLFYPSQTF